MRMGHESQLIHLPSLFETTFIISQGSCDVIIINLRAIVFTNALLNIDK